MNGSLREHLVRLFDEHTAQLRGVSMRKMFGCEAYLRDCRIFGLIWKGRIAIKLPEEAALDEGLRLPGANRWSPGASVMGRWVLLPEAFHDDSQALAEWIARAHRLAAVQPTSERVRKKSKTATKGGRKRS